LCNIKIFEDKTAQEIILVYTILLYISTVFRKQTITQSALKQHNRC
jgi:hypothetical protein